MFGASSELASVMEFGFFTAGRRRSFVSGRPHSATTTETGQRCRKPASVVTTYETSRTPRTSRSRTHASRLSNFMSPPMSLPTTAGHAWNLSVLPVAYEDDGHVSKPTTSHTQWSKRPRPTAAVQSRGSGRQVTSCDGQSSRLRRTSHRPRLTGDRARRDFLSRESVVKGQIPLRHPASECSSRAGSRAGLRPAIELLASC